MTMGKGTSVMFGVVLFAILIPVAAAAQAEGGSPLQASDAEEVALAKLLAYEPTGNALWDRYAQALLKQVARAQFDPDRLPPQDPIRLPIEELESWQAEFGDQPEYWQVCYWNAIQYSKAWQNGEIDPYIYLKQAVSHGAADAMTQMLLYNPRSQGLANYWDKYVDGTLSPDDPRGLPDIPEGAAPYSWYVEQDLKLADELVADCPEESWALYQRAMKRFKYGRWEEGLDDLRAGNQAPNNRAPVPFPILFLIQATRDEQPTGSEIAAGIVASNWYIWVPLQLPQFILAKDEVKSELVRLNLGAPLSEIEPWHEWSCRFGSMEGSEAIQWLSARTMEGMLISYLITDIPESFTVDQRRSLFGLYHRGDYIRDAGRNLRRDRKEHEALRQAQYIAAYEAAGLQYEGEDGLIIDFLPKPANIELHRELLSLYYRWCHKDFALEYGEYYDSVKSRYDKLKSFDMVTCSWPELEEE